MITIEIIIKTDSCNPNVTNALLRDPNLVGLLRLTRSHYQHVCLFFRGVETFPALLICISLEGENVIDKLGTVHLSYLIFFLGGGTDVTPQPHHFSDSDM